MCLLGEGAVNMGAFHESLNLAAVWHLPVVFVVTNNQYGMGTSVGQASAEPEVYRRAAAYRMQGERVDGMDVLAVREATTRLLKLAREERVPGLLEIVTYRFRGHSVADAGKLYRTQDEILSWMERDPLVIFRRVLEERGMITAEDVEHVEAEVAQVVQAAVEFSDQSPDPSLDRLYDNIYAPEASEQFARMAVGGPFDYELPTAADTSDGR